MTPLALLFFSTLGASVGGDEPSVAAVPQLADRYPERRVEFPRGVTSLADVAFSSPVGFRPLTLDLYLPKDRRQAAPAIVYVHGGGWQSGHGRHAGAFEDWPRVLAGFAARGYVVASVNYRLSGEAPSPAAANDVGEAMRWLRANAARYSIDPRRIGLWGVSAGGQIAAVVGTTCAEPACVTAVVTWYGVFDFAPLVATG
jgi:acetyl esterase/lipase